MCRIAARKGAEQTTDARSTLYELVDLHVRRVTRKHGASAILRFLVRTLWLTLLLLI